MMRWGEVVFTSRERSGINPVRSLMNVQQEDDSRHECRGSARPEPARLPVTRVANVQDEPQAEALRLGTLSTLFGSISRAHNGREQGLPYTYPASDHANRPPLVAWLSVVDA